MDPAHADLLTESVEESARAVARPRRMAWIEGVAAGYEGARRAAEQAGRASAAGAWYTPPDVVQAVLDAALGGRGGARTRGSGQGGRPARAGRSVVDPACGTGHFLVAAAERVGAGCVHGMDLDPMAVAIARVRMRLRFGRSAAHWRTAIRCGDALAAGAWEGCAFAAVVGNPPFLAQLSARTARTAAERDALRRRFGGAVSRYADTASAFLLLGSELAPGGTVALVQPLSVLSAADSAEVRSACETRLPLASVRVLRDDAFGAEVRTCVVTLAAGAGGAVHAMDAAGNCAELARSLFAGGGWGAALAAARQVPPPGAQRTDGTLDGWMSATSDFRQHYYGLRGLVHEARGARPSVARPALVTVGAIDAARLGWSKRKVRIHARDFHAPTVVRRVLERHAVLGPWVRARGVPKVLVATQTRAIEAWVDGGGTALGSTPVITAVPRSSKDLWRVGAAILAPPTAAEAWWRHAGAAMSAGAVRISASQLRNLPAPGVRGAWDRGARALQAWQRSGSDRDRTRFAEAMCDAYGVPAGPGRERLLAWWAAAVATP
jgi:hypothetical protein